MDGRTLAASTVSIHDKSLHRPTASLRSRADDSCQTLSEVLKESERKTCTDTNPPKYQLLRPKTSEPFNSQHLELMASLSFATSTLTSSSTGTLVSSATLLLQLLDRLLSKPLPTGTVLSAQRRGSSGLDGCRSRDRAFCHTMTFVSWRASLSML